jgi:hypothetical protein
MTTPLDAVDVNAYLARTYESPPCWLLVADFYATELAQPCTEFRTINSSARSIARTFRLALHKGADGFEQIAEPVEGCVVLVGRTAKMGPHHCGVYVQGKVLHALPSGTVHESLTTLRDVYALVEFWARPELIAS